MRNLPRLLERTKESTAINSLIRLFWIGKAQDVAEIKQVIPEWFVNDGLACGVLSQIGQDIRSEVMLSPVDDFVFAADHTIKIEAGDPELVLWPNPTSRLLSRVTVRRPSKMTLDLGTGTGIEAIMAASHSEKVIATDLSQRCVDFAAFNARLNGAENIEVLVGDGFAPVASRTFDLIVSNPPFFITPKPQYLFCDNPLDLDQLCRQLAREAGAHLNEGGYFHMLCEWAEVSGQPWEERLSEWFEGTGCDVLVLKGYSEDPGEYAEAKIRAISGNPETDLQVFQDYMDYYSERKVVAIHGGMVTMRRRTGSNWAVFESADHTPAEPFGDLVVSKFETHDLLNAMTSIEDLQSKRPKLSENVRLEQIFRQTEGGWTRESLRLRQSKGFHGVMGLEPIVADFLSQCDGEHTLGEVVTGFAQKVDAPFDQVRNECLQATRLLIERGFVVV
jgi:SAM-dependent methyltransferase